MTFTTWRRGFISKTFGFWLYESGASYWPEEATWPRPTWAHCDQWRKQPQVADRPLSTIGQSVLGFHCLFQPQWSSLVPTLGLRFWHCPYSSEPFETLSLECWTKPSFMVLTPLILNLSSPGWKKGIPDWVVPKRPSWLSCRLCAYGLSGDELNSCWMQGGELSHLANLL